MFLIPTGCEFPNVGNDAIDATSSGNENPGDDVPAPEINIKQGTTSLFTDSGTYDFGSVNEGESGSAIIFTIENIGNADLDITGVTSSDSQFVINNVGMDSTVAASGSTTFSVTFSPAATGDHSAVLTINNNDLDEYEYKISVTGTGTSLLVTVPEINIKQGSTNLPSGSGSYDFGSLDQGVSSSAVVFTIENSGTADLSISGVASNNGQFSVNSASMDSTVAVAGTTTFTVTFTPSAAGSQSATITVSNDDSNEGSYTFSVTGTGNSTGDGLVAYYPFNGNANDESTNSNNGTVIGATLTSDRFGNSNSAYSFDGNDYIDIGNNFENSPTSISYSAWIKTSYDTPSAQANVILSRKETMVGSSCMTLLITQNEYASVGLNSHQHYTTWPEYAVAINDGNWHFVVATKNGDTLTIYVDGVAGGTFDDSLSLYSTDRFFIGLDKVWYDVGGYGYFNGSIDDVRIYNKALTVSEIDALYHEGGWGLPTDGLVAYYPFNGNANDESSNSNNGTVNGATLTADRFGNSTSAYDFDGTDDNISVIDNSLWDFNDGDFAISVWMKPDDTVGDPSVAYRLVSAGMQFSSDTLWTLGYGNQSSAWPGGTGVRQNFGYFSNSSFANYASSVVIINGGSWYHVVLVRNGNTLYYYHNNVQVGTSSYDLTTTASGDLCIGARDGGPIGLMEYHKGAIDDVRIYSRALSSSEINTIYHEGGW